MPVKIRLQRKGRTNDPRYKIVVADARAPRDGRFIENVGTYNPHTAPATVTLRAQSIIAWMGKGAQLTNVVRTICSKCGVTYLNHLLLGVKKGAVTPAEAKKRFLSWQKESQEKKKVVFTSDIPVDAILGISEKTEAEAERPAEPQLTSTVPVSEEEQAPVAPKKTTKKKAAVPKKPAAKKMRNP